MSFNDISFLVGINWKSGLISAVPYQFRATYWNIYMITQVLMRLEALSSFHLNRIDDCVLLSISEAQTRKCFHIFPTPLLQLWTSTITSDGDADIRNWTCKRNESISRAKPLFLSYSDMMLWYLSQRGERTAQISPYSRIRRSAF